MLTAEQWSRAKDLFEAALRLPEAERLPFLAAQADPAPVMDEVQSLLTVYQEYPEFLEGEPAGPATIPQREPPAPLAGRHVGSWEMVREIGRGGMGIVWEARRADGQYEQRAAIKLLAASFLTPQDILRFRDERQILARLDHPGIARLLDGGTLEDGSPFLVMEYVEGPALDAWCEGRKWDVRERVQLFLSICSAVEYAHQRLVIHRDLKPGNILVTPEGAPKLLDFGIAKLIAPGREATHGTSRLLTPEFASPEQLRGDPATTSSDIFSLGVLLYLMLSGSKPFGRQGAGPLDVVRSICEDDPPPPSTVAGAPRRELRGELDAIVLQALRKDPEERYQAVRSLADDLNAWLEGRDVSAVHPSWWRRTVRRMRRHKTQSAAVALAAASLLAGTWVSLWQARVARRQEARAEQRFREVRKFSRSVLFELHDAIRNLPGATPARNLLLTRATEFLDNLAKDPASDAAMKLELAQGYAALGHVQGSGFSENLGHREASIASFQKAVRLAEEALAASPGSADAALVLLNAYDDLTRAYLDQNDLPAAETWHNRYRDGSTAIEARFPGDNRVQAAVAGSYSARAFYQTQRSNYQAAKELYRKALDRFAELSRKGYDTKDFRTQYAFANKRLGALLIVGNVLEEAEARYRAALALEDADLRAAPGEMGILLNRTFTLSDLALILRRRNDLAGAASMYEEVLRTRRAALQADAANVRYMTLTSTAEEKLASVYSALRRHAEAIGLAYEAIRLRDRQTAISHGYKERRDAAQTRVILASLILNAADDQAFHPGAGQGVADAQALLQAALPAVPKPGARSALSPGDRELQADYETVSTRLRRRAPSQ